MRAIFDDHLAEPAAQLQRAELRAVAGERGARFSVSRPTTPGATAPSSPNTWRPEDGFEIVNL